MASLFMLFRRIRGNHGNPSTSYFYHTRRIICNVYIVLQLLSLIQSLTSLSCYTWWKMRISMHLRLRTLFQDSREPELYLRSAKSSRCASSCLFCLFWDHPVCRWLLNLITKISRGLCGGPLLPAVNYMTWISQNPKLYRYDWCGPHLQDNCPARFVLGSISTTGSRPSSKTCRASAWDDQKTICTCVILSKFSSCPHRTLQRAKRATSFVATASLNR